MPLTKASNSMILPGNYYVATPIFPNAAFREMPYFQGTVDGRQRWGQNTPETGFSEYYVRYNSSLSRWQVWSTDSGGEPDTLMETSTTDGTLPWLATWPTYAACFVNINRNVDVVFKATVNSSYSGSDNILMGGAYGSLTSGHGNIMLGYSLGTSLSSGTNNVAIGKFTMGNVTTNSSNVAIGERAYQGGNYSNSSCLGAGSSVTGSNQVQLGNSSTTTYAYGAVQNRSDERDKADVRDTELGLEFVNALRPVDFKWDMREYYRQEAPNPVAKPEELKEDASDEEKSKYAEKLAAHEAYLVLKNNWEEDVKLSNITHDGSKKRNRFHHGLIAQEVKAVLDAKGIDFGGFQDHKIAGGDDVLSIGYAELIAPMIKAIQELSAEVASLKAQLNP